jgi:Leucine-rich repeat (LRR) protein
VALYSENEQTGNIMNCEIIRLPNDILRIVVSYLRGTYGNATSFSYGIEWKNLLNSNKSYFQHLKKVSQILSLSNTFTRVFLTSLVFRETVLSTIENRSKQLRFSLTDYAPSPELDLTLLCPAHYLSLKRCRSEISVLLVGIEEIKLSSCCIQDLSFCSRIGNIEILLPECESLLTPTLSTTTVFKVCCQDENGCKIENYERALCAVKEFEFPDCDSIVDVSCFKNAHIVSLSGCRNVSDVSGLGNLRELDLSGCKLVRDVSALGNIHKLNIGYCPLVEDISALTGVYDLDITGFKGTNLSSLKNVMILNISNCRNITSLDPVGRQLEELVMTGCRLIRNITMLAKVKKLQLSCCSKITNFTGLASLQDLTVVQEYHENIPFCVLEGTETFKGIKSLGVEGFIEGIESTFSMLLDTGELSSLSFDRSDPFSDISRYQKLKPCN